jgi:hypothetical protein
VESPITHTEIGRAVRSLLAEATGLPPARVIPARDNGPSPAGGVYASVFIRSHAKIGTASVRHYAIEGDNTQVLERVTASHLARCSVNFYRVGAVDMARALLDFPDTPAGRLALALRGLTWHLASDVRDLSTLQGRHWEERAQFDLEIKVTRSTMAEVAATDETSIDITVNETAETDLGGTMEDEA